MFTVSLKRSNILFCLLIDPHKSPSRRLLRWSHPWSSSRWRPLRGGRLTCDQFLPFQMWCQIFTEVDLRFISWISSLWEVSRQDGAARRIRRQIRNAVSELNLMNERVEFSQRMHFLYRSFYVNMKNQHFFSWSCCYLGVLSKWLFSLSIRVHALWMCYNEQSLYLYLKKKKKLPKDIKIQAKA